MHEELIRKLKQIIDDTNKEWIGEQIMKPQIAHSDDEFYDREFNRGVARFMELIKPTIEEAVEALEG